MGNGSKIESSVLTRNEHKKMKATKYPTATLRPQSFVPLFDDLSSQVRPLMHDNMINCQLSPVAHLVKEHTGVLLSRFLQRDRMLLWHLFFEYIFILDVLWTIFSTQQDSSLQDYLIQDTGIDSWPIRSIRWKPRAVYLNSRITLWKKVRKLLCLFISAPGSNLIFPNI